ncbi:helicase-like transcription factor CHR28 [Zingiber officinale]|uniref:helicase-like transcription factor CHR28 n=1 Tax=Zingiber officinale TaxID=94328 RepID=UPI001C4C80BB|nr:helicase-like transcription factor CHR28 [Zingiber officinale]
MILLDLWWNPTIEEQAIDRVHRIGQTHPVKVSRITIKDTIEDHILALQMHYRGLDDAMTGEVKNYMPILQTEVENLAS